MALIILGLVIGSFLGVLVYRLPRRMNIATDRSRCESCKKEIVWYDNVPVFSYLILRGRCRSCKKKISVITPLLEITTAVVFVIVGPNPVNLILASIFIVIFVIDWQEQIIPDELVFVGLLVAIFNFQFSIFNSLFAGFLAADSLLFLHLITKGKGMGLGDVKLAVLLGVVAGGKLLLPWLLFSFVAGAIFGVVLITVRKANLKQKIAFGPFLIIGLVLAEVFGPGLMRLM